MGRKVIKQGSGHGTTRIRNTCIMDLPSDSLLQIFLRLPIKAAMRCKFVCREWNEFISHPDFARQYEKNPHFTTLLLPSSRHSFVNNEPFSLLEISRDWGATWTSIAIDLPRVPDWIIDDQLYYRSFICSSVGLLCYVVWESGRICVYNLFTEECIAIQETIIDHVDEGDCVNWVYQFGYSPLMDKFKILRFECIADYVDEVNCEIITIGVDYSWRYLFEPFRNASRSDSSRVVVNGVLHWFGEAGDSEWIRTFDFGEERFGKISPPSGLVLNSRRLSLSDYNENNQLCLIDHSDCSKFCIWVMKQYGVAESWVNYKVLRSWFLIPSDWICRVFPLAILPDGDMVFELRNNDHGLMIIYCNIKQCRCTIYDRVFKDPAAIKVPSRMLQAFARIVV